MKTLSLSDLPLDKSLDDFGTKGYVQGLERFISQAASPITIALQGEWGSGKTSLMNRLCLDLCGDNKEFIGININTWEYSMLASPEETILKIIGQLINALTEHDPKANSKGRQYINMAMNGLYRFGREFLKGIFPLAGPLVEAAGVATERPESDKVPEKQTISISELKRILTEAIKKSSESKKGILIFVDDLDRLNPPLAVQILELLKNIFTLDKCIFILAIDYEVVVKGLEPKFGKFSEVNEREFRSFFDKIIQVPFSLPVNNYKPMNFVLDSLESIGYITSGEKSRNYIRNSFELIVNSSVGKNPRSIKRLINTLSLLDCIGKCTALDELEESIEAKITNFAIVALQICYPKIYDILRSNPLFSTWDSDTANKFNLHFEDEETDIDANAILDTVCSQDVYLSSHKNEIHILLNLISETASKINDQNPSSVIEKILDRSSLTTVSVAVEAEKFDGKTLITKLHQNVWSYIQAKAPAIRLKRFKRNYGTSGGLLLFLPDDSTFEIGFEPKPIDQKSNPAGNTITLKVWLNIFHYRPKRLEGLPYDEVLADSEVAAAIAPLNDVVTRYIANEMIESTTYYGQMFRNLVDEMLCRGQNNWFWDSIIRDTQYWINHKSAANFEEKSTIAAIGDLAIATYELNKRIASINENNNA